MSKLKTILTGAAIGLALITSSAAVARDRDHDGRRDGGYHERHDRDGYRDRDRGRHDRDGWRDGGRRHYADRGSVYRGLRHHYRYVGDPYWYRGHYVVRGYDPRGRYGYVRVDPYSGGFLGFEIRL